MPLMPVAVIQSSHSQLATYAEITAPVNLTATTEATAQLIVTAAPVVVDGATRVEIEFFTPQFQSPGGAVSRFTALTLWESFNGGAAASISEFWGVIVTNLNGSIQTPATLKFSKVPATGTYEWAVRGYVNAGTGVVQAGPGGTGEYMPAFIKVSRL